ncbi:hypothetical protein M0R45_026159 [Rubus argutus]|uniref:Uncharacterized protein n=1 Tax=Rubus argutus TaxID=59490 RepID=A0AAW1WW70_RUBAR
MAPNRNQIVPLPTTGVEEPSAPPPNTVNSPKSKKAKPKRKRQEKPQEKPNVKPVKSTLNHGSEIILKNLRSQFSKPLMERSIRLDMNREQNPTNRTPWLQQIQPVAPWPSPCRSNYHRELHPHTNPKFITTTTTQAIKSLHHLQIPNSKQNPSAPILHLCPIHGLNQFRHTRHQTNPDHKAFTVTCKHKKPNQPQPKARPCHTAVPSPLLWLNPKPPASHHPNPRRAPLSSPLQGRN